MQRLTGIAQLICSTAATALLLGACAAPTPQADACTAPLSATVPNSCIVAPDILWRGARPDGEAATLVDLGVKTVVNLELLHDDLDDFLAIPGAPRQSGSIDYFRVRDWEPNVVIAPWLLDHHVAEFIAIMRTQAKPVYVHCRSGQNRTGVMVASYRVLQGMPVDDAIEEMRKYRGVWFDYDADYLRKLTGEHRQRLEEMIAAKMTQVQRNARIDCDTAGCRKAP